ncbi:hypothetical protein [Kineosporia succinea]|uniref:hypothetical protein n=1 Tax=Kineosporia succinea TaxID=84632 RepID=UPI0027D83ED8|nr:hypothetical protein [Kineosporia succinea]
MRTSCSPVVSPGLIVASTACTSSASLRAPRAARCPTAVAATTAPKAPGANQERRRRTTNRSSPAWAAGRRRPCRCTRIPVLRSTPCRASSGGRPGRSVSGSAVAGQRGRRRCTAAVTSAGNPPPSRTSTPSPTSRSSSATDSGTAPAICRTRASVRAGRNSPSSPGTANPAQRRGPPLPSGGHVPSP